MSKMGFSVQFGYVDNFRYNFVFGSRVRIEPVGLIGSSILQLPLPKSICPLFSQATSVEAMTGQGEMETYRCVSQLCLFVASVANNDRSRCTGQDGVNDAIAMMLSSPFSGP